MELTPDTFTFLVCVIREVTPPKEINGYPYRDVALVSDPLSHMMRLPEFSAADFRMEFLGPDAEAAEEIRIPGKDSKHLRVFLIKGVSPPSLDPASPIPFSSEDSTIRVLLSEVAAGKCCHATIHPEVRDLFFPKPDSEGASTALAPGTFPTNGYNPASRGRLVSPIALVPVSDDIESTGYYPLPMIGYHGTSEHFVEDILAGSGLRKTTSLGLYGNNAYYFGSFDKAIRYAFRDSQYATVGETAPLRSKEKPAGFLRVPGTRHLDPKHKGVHEDLIRDSPAMVRFVLFPGNTIRFPEGKPEKVLPAHGTAKGGVGYGLDNANRFLRFANAEGEIPSRDEKDIRERVAAAMEAPLFTGGETASSLGVAEVDPVVPVPPPVDLTNRQKATLMAYTRIHTATKPASSADTPSVILLREPGALPDLADFFLMSSGFLTQTAGGMTGEAITHICEDEIRELTMETQTALGAGEGGDADGTRPRPLGGLGAMTDHRILMEDLVSVSPTDAPVLVSCASLTPSSLVRIRDLLVAKGGGRPVVVIRAYCTEKSAGGKDHDTASPHAYSREELASIRSNLDETVDTLGGVASTLTYTPPKSNIFGKGVVAARELGGATRVCSLRMDHTTSYVSGTRLMYNRSVHTRAYLKEYPTGGSYRVYKLVRNPAKVPAEEQLRALMDTLREQGWSPEAGGASDTLVIQPFAYETPGRGKPVLRSLTQQTEIIVVDSDKPRFIPLSWHRGDQRTMYRHHHPMDTGMRVI